MLFDVLFAPLLPVMYSYFSSKNQELHRIQHAALTVVRSIAIIAIPLSFLLFIISDSVSDLFFGEKWIGIAFIISYLSLMRGYSWIVGINGEIYRALAKPHYETIVYAFSSVFFLTGYIISIQFGLEVFIYTRLVLGMASLIPHFYFFQKLLKISLRPIYRTVLISTFAGLIPIMISLLMRELSYPLLRIAIVSTASLLLMALFLYLLERKFIEGVFYSFILKEKNPDL
jgi:O-antigen/teichoic acid export membrane protein